MSFEVMRSISEYAAVCLSGRNERARPQYRIPVPNAPPLRTNSTPIVLDTTPATYRTSSASMAPGGSPQYARRKAMVVLLATRRARTPTTSSLSRVSSRSRPKVRCPAVPCMDTHNPIITITIVTTGPTATPVLNHPRGLEDLTGTPQNLYDPTQSTMRRRYRCGRWSSFSASVSCIRQDLALYDLAWRPTTLDP
jgi:hypothetical protein